MLQAKFTVFFEVRQLVSLRQKDEIHPIQTRQLSELNQDSSLYYGQHDWEAESYKIVKHGITIADFCTLGYISEICLSYLF